jgi:hypothetical protein
VSWLKKQGNYSRLKEYLTTAHVHAIPVTCAESLPHYLFKLRPDPSFNQKSQNSQQKLSCETRVPNRARHPPPHTQPHTHPTTTTPAPHHRWAPM